MSSNYIVIGVGGSGGRLVRQIISYTGASGSKSTLRTLSIDTDEVDTIGGYVVLLMGRIPQSGDKIEVEGFLFTVGDVSKNRITILRIDKLNKTKDKG